jgi:hypothetical protein
MVADFLKQYKIISVVIVLLILGVVGYISSIAIGRIGKQPVTVYIVPSDATLTANGTSMSQGTAYLKPGTYTIQASKTGFTSYKNTVVVGNPNTAIIDIALEGTTPSTTQWEKDNQSLYLAREGRAGLEANQNGEAFTARNPIISDLPYDTPIYTIGYRADPNDASSIILTIDAAEGDRNAAVQQIRNFGYDPTNFTIEFTNYTSPFSHE